MSESKQPSKAPAKKKAPVKKAAAPKKAVAPNKVEPVVEEPTPQTSAETVEPKPSKAASKAAPKGSKSGLTLHLVGHDSNAFSILQRARVTLERGGQEDLYEDFYAEATSGDYDHLLQTCMAYFDVPGEEKGSG